MNNDIEKETETYAYGSKNVTTEEEIRRIISELNPTTKINYFLLEGHYFIAPKEARDLCKKYDIPILSCNYEGIDNNGNHYAGWRLNYLNYSDPLPEEAEYVFYAYCDGALMKKEKIEFKVSFEPLE